MKTKFNILIVLSITLSLFGCDSNQYQIVTAPDGSLYRFNKKTGEMSIVASDKKAAPFAEASNLKPIKGDTGDSLEKPADWKESRYPGKNLKVRLETVWRENKLCYKFSAYPYRSVEKAFEKRKQDYVYSLMKPGFNIELVDKNGFMVKEVRISLWNMTRVPAGTDKEDELVMNSQIDCTKESYRSIGGYTVKWLLDPDVIEDEKEEYIKSEPLKDGK